MRWASGDQQEEEAPACNDSLIGSSLEIRWRYWAPVNDPTGKDKRKKRVVDIWCEGEVVKIANGTTDKEDPNRATCKKLAQAGAVRVKWPADAEGDDEESFNRCILTKENWNAEAVMGWRFTVGELRKRSEAARGKKTKRRGGMAHYMEE